MTAGCARCGDCCDPVGFPRKRLEALSHWTDEAMKGVANPADDEGWRVWRDQGWAEEWRDAAIGRSDPDGVWRADANFITAHWKSVTDETCECDMFDKVTRLCMAHGERPPVCSEFPWYGRDPVEGIKRTVLPSHCSYLADLPPRERPEEARPLIPLMVA